METIDWGEYAGHYDLLCSHNDSYDELLDQLEKFVKSASLPPNPTIVDVGAGTGNFCKLIAQALPNAHIYHVDSNREMNLRAMAKYALHGLSNITVIEKDIFDVELPSGSIDLLICINSLYALKPQTEVLSLFRKWLKQEGIFYVVDLGREMDAGEWGRHFLSRAAKEGYLLRYIRDTIRAREVIKQNRTTTAAQRSGAYWMHGTEEFGALLEDAGYKIQHLEPCYRNYADLAICESMAA